MDFASRLKARMKEMGVTQEELAGVLLCKRTMVNRYANGHSDPDLESFKKIAAYLDVSYDYLLGDTEVKKREHIDIANATGLSDEAIRLLMDFKYDADSIPDVNNDAYECEQAYRRQSQQTLMLLNILISEEYLPWMANAIWQYAENVKEVHKKIHAINTLKELINKLGDDFVLMEHRDLIRGIYGDGDNLKGVERLPKNGLLLDLEMRRMLNEIDRHEWGIIKGQKEFALKVAEKFMESIDKLEDKKDGEQGEER